MLVSQYVHESGKLLELRGGICILANIEVDSSSFALPIFNRGRVSIVRDRARLYCTRFTVPDLR
jgi:hypothetical protein